MPSSGGDSSSLLEQARSAQAQGDRHLAYQLYTQATELEPNSPTSWRGRAETTRSADEALICLGYASALAPEDDPLRRALDHSISSRAREAARSDVAALVTTGQQLAEVGLIPQATRLFTRALELDSACADALLWLAATTSDPAVASAYLRDAAALKPDDPRVRAGLEALTRQIPQPAPAAPHETEPSASTQQAQALIEQGKQALARNSTSEAHHLFVRATQLAPHLEAAWLHRAQAADDLDEALSCYDQALALNPTNADTREARTLLRVKKLRQTVKEPAHKRSEPTTRTGSFAGGGSFVGTPPPDVTRRRLLLLGIMVFVLLLLLATLFLRFLA